MFYQIFLGSSARLPSHPAVPPAPSIGYPTQSSLAFPLPPDIKPEHVLPLTQVLLLKQGTSKYIPLAFSEMSQEL